MEKFSEQPEIRLGKLKHWWDQIWPGHQREWKGFCKYISFKKEDKIKCGPSLERNRRSGYLRYGESWGIHQLFASIFISKCPHHTVHVTEGKAKGLGKWRAIGEEQIWDHLRNLKLHKSKRPDEMNPQVLRELADKIAELLSIVSEKSCQSGKVPIRKGKV